MVTTWYVNEALQNMLMKYNNKLRVWKLPLEIAERVKTVKDFEDFDWHIIKSLEPKATLATVDKLAFKSREYTILIPDAEYERYCKLCGEEEKLVRAGKCCNGYYDKENAKRKFQ